jgi:hypothetical protein
MGPDKALAPQTYRPEGLAAPFVLASLEVLRTSAGSTSPSLPRALISTMTESQQRHQLDKKKSA